MVEQSVFRTPSRIASKLGSSNDRLIGLSKSSQVSGGVPIEFVSRWIWVIQHHIPIEPSNHKPAVSGAAPGFNYETTPRRPKSVCPNDLSVDQAKEERERRTLNCPQYLLLSARNDRCALFENERE